ncbi:MAG TPA: magnesium-translocating P-type ATPase [Acidimicrobiales bacterium]|nr:magnesium-translocating P-type ATPase [Acidimicrobiales bacterium]
MPLKTDRELSANAATTTVAVPAPLDPTFTGVDIGEAARLPAGQVLARLRSEPTGLTSDEAGRRLELVGANVLRSHRVRPWAMLVRQVRSPLLLLLLVTAAVSFFVGDRTDAIIIGAILTLSTLLGFINEYRAEVAAQDLHEQMRHRAVVCRDGSWTSCDVTDLVPGDVVRLGIGNLVPADMRLLSADGLECDESVLTGESQPVDKTADPVGGSASLGDLRSCAFMGTIVHAGSGEAAVVATGGRTEFGKIAAGLGETQEQTEFQVGLRDFSMLLARVAIVLSASIFAINLILGRALIDSILFSLAIAVGITPQLLPAVVTTSMATGSRRLARRKVLVKRLVCIEDLGDIELLLTDKTGTLTEGKITFQAAVDPAGIPSDEVLLLGLVCNEAVPGQGSAVGGNPLDVALWDAPGAGEAKVDLYHQRAIAPFDHDRRRVSVLVDGPNGTIIITKGAPEGVMDLCPMVSDQARSVLSAALEEGSRIVAVATRPAPGLTSVTPTDEQNLQLAGFLMFFDRPKASAGAALTRLNTLGITVKVVTGDHPVVAEKVCRDLGLPVAGTLTGDQIDHLDDDGLQRAVATTTIFSRVSPEQKSRLIRAHRAAGTDVAFLGDGVNDAVALHHADVGISVDSATDVAKDAADIVLLEKDLNVLADGVAEGRRIFANTIKYVLMGTSSNFGNMFSAAAASAFLKFLPMLPSQILLNNLLYDTSQMTIPTDLVDEEQLARPSHWDMSFIRHFMIFFGPISSIFDFMTFAIMLNVFHAGPPLFRTGWFVESLATQTLVIFVIRTRRVPFFRSRPSTAMLVASLGVVAIGAALPFTPWAHALGFRALPAGYFAALIAMIAAYLTLVEFGKVEFYRHWRPAQAPIRNHQRRRIHRRAARFSRNQAT